MFWESLDGSLVSIFPIMHEVYNIDSNLLLAKFPMLCDMHTYIYIYTYIHNIIYMYTLASFNILLFPKFNLLYIYIHIHIFDI